LARQAAKTSKNTRGPFRIINGPDETGLNYELELPIELKLKHS
jgi:hypothetical protein